MIATCGSVAQPCTLQLDSNSCLSEFSWGHNSLCPLQNVPSVLGGCSADDHSLWHLQPLRKHLAIVHILSWIKSRNDWKASPIHAPTPPVFFLKCLPNLQPLSPLPLHFPLLPFLPYPPTPRPPISLFFPAKISTAPCCVWNGARSWGCKDE